MEILVLCTANQCRSPMVEGLLRARLADRGVTGVTVSSAGFLSDGSAATHEAIEVMALRGVDITGHLSRVADAEMLAGADLVLAMARRHVREGSVLAPATFPRTFTLKELVRRAGQVGPREPDEAFAEWLARLHTGRTPNLHLGDSSDDDVADPVGSPLRVYKRTAKELDRLVDTFVAQAFP